MEEQMARRLVAAEGKKLQQAGLVARTWGNISCRIDENHFVITPSGLDYETMTARGSGADGHKKRCVLRRA